MSKTAPARISPVDSSADLIVYLDVKSPYAFLAKDPSYRLIEDFGIDIDFRPLTLNIPSFLGSAKVNDQGNVVEEDRSERQWQAVRYAYMDAKRYARLKDIAIYGPRKIWDTSVVHIAWLWVKQQQPELESIFLDCVFKSFWNRALDVEDINVIERLLRDLGVNVAGFVVFREGVGQTLHQVLQNDLAECGIFGVPTYVLNGEFFFGRENLPYIRWILGGEVGHPPDVAYQGFDE